MYPYVRISLPLPPPSLVLAARLEVELVDLPEVEVVGEGEDAHLLDQVQLARAVKVEDGGEGARVAVEEVLVVHERVRVAVL